MVRDLNVKGLSVLVTGGTGGMGSEIVRSLAGAGARVIVVGRNDADINNGKSDINGAFPISNVKFAKADIGKMSDIRRLADDIRARDTGLDILIHCAGVIKVGKPTYEEGVESNFAINFLGRYLLTKLLEDALCAEAKVIALATAGIQPIKFNFKSVTSPDTISGFRAYQQSQAANDVWGVDVSDQLADRGIKIAIVNPGIVRTGIRKASQAPFWLKAFDFLVTPFAKSARDGAYSVLTIASRNFDWPASGILFGSDAKPLKISEKTKDAITQRQLREVCEHLAPASPT